MILMRVASHAVMLMICARRPRVFAVHAVAAHNMLVLSEDFDAWNACSADFTTVATPNIVTVNAPIHMFESGSDAPLYATCSVACAGAVNAYRDAIISIQLMCVGARAGVRQHNPDLLKWKRVG